MNRPTLGGARCEPFPYVFSAAGIAPWCASVLPMYFSTHWEHIQGKTSTTKANPSRGEDAKPQASSP